jgi:glucose-1-phosphate adenylyltransferase
MGVDGDNYIESFVEKPERPDPMPSNPEVALCSMGIYVFNKDFLVEQLVKDADTGHSSHDFGKDVIPSLIRKYRAYAFPFRDANTQQIAYWRDVGTVDAFWEANLELIAVTPELNLYDEEWPIWTYQEQLPPAKFVFHDKDRTGMAVDSMVSGGCIISGARVERSLLFSNVCVESYSRVEESVVLPDVIIEEGCTIRRAVIDKGCVIPKNTQIGVDPKADAERFYVTDSGITLVVPEMLGQEIHHVR